MKKLPIMLGEEVDGDGVGDEKLEIPLFLVLSEISAPDNKLDTVSYYRVRMGWEWLLTWGGTQATEEVVDVGMRALEELDDASTHVEEVNLVEKYFLLQVEACGGTLEAHPAIDQRFWGSTWSLLPCDVSS